MKKAIVFGASGFIGSFLLEELLQDGDYERVTVVVRKKLELTHPKLTQLIGDLSSLPSLKPQLSGDHIFIALGTTRALTPDQKDYYKIDHDYPVLAARIAKENGATSALLVSAIGANAHSKVFYTRTKGEAERDLIALDFAHTHIFRPSLLLGHRKANRPLERAFMKLWKVVDPFMKGPLSPYHGINGSDVAKAMVLATKDESEKLRFYHWREMVDLLARSENR